MATTSSRPPVPELEMSMMKFKPKPKHPKACWTTAYPRQAKALRPENGPAGGVKARSGGEKARMAVYAGIKELFLWGRSVCGAYVRGVCSGSELEVHHKLGRSGILLFDVRHWLAVCPACHAWIHAHPGEARAKGWLAQPGEWNKEAE